MTTPEHAVRREAEAARDLLANIAAGDDDALAQDMIEGETGLLEAIEHAISELRECDITIAGCAAEIETLSARKDRAMRRKATIRAAIEQAMLMTERETLRTATKTLSIARRPGKAVIVNEAEIPTEFWKPQPPKLDQAELTKALADRDVPGAHMSNGSVSLTIRGK